MLCHDQLIGLQQFTQLGITPCEANFINCQKEYFDYFISKTFDELKSLLTILPKGSIIFHSSSCSIQKDYPPKQQYDTKTKLSGISHILHKENIKQTLGSIKQKKEQEINAEQDEEKKIAIEETYQSEKEKYKKRIQEAAEIGVSFGKSFLWANTTIDANVMVDVRRMTIMTINIAKQDIILLNYSKIFEIMHMEKIENLHNELKKEYDTEPNSPKINIFTKRVEMYNANNKTNISLEECFKDVNLMKIILFNSPGYAQELWSDTLLIRKQSIIMPKEITRERDVGDDKFDEYADGRYTNEINIDGLKFMLRNKYKNTIGDALLIQLLNYILSLKGCPLKINGYADYDVSDATGTILNGTNICCKVQEEYVCKEMMILDPSKHLTYIGSCDINQNEQDHKKLKEQLWDKITVKLRNFIKIDDATYMDFGWVVNSSDIIGIDKLFTDGNIYHNIVIFPHYRFNLDVSCISALISDILDTKNITEPIRVVEQKNNTYTRFGPYISLTYLTTELKENNVVEVLEPQHNDEKEQPTTILDKIKKLKPNSSRHIYSVSQYKILIEHLSMIKIIEETNYDNHKYQIKTSISELLTTILHKDTTNVQMFIVELQKIFKQISTDTRDPNSRIGDIRNILRRNNSTRFAEILNNREPIFFIYMKGSSALNILCKTKYKQIIDETPELKQLYDTANLTNSDFDLNVCINPIIVNTKEVYINIRNIITSYLGELLRKARDSLLLYFSIEKVQNIFSILNKELFRLHTTQDDNKLDRTASITSNIYYANIRLDNDSIITDLRKYSIQDSPYSYLQVSQIHINNEKLNKFILLRCKLSGITGSDHIKCHGEIFDISIIDNTNETNYTWGHRMNIVNIHGIIVMDIKGLFVDMHNTFLNNLSIHSTTKFKKRIDRLEFLQKLLCITISTSDNFFSLFKNFFYENEKIPHIHLCNPNDIKHLTGPTRLVMNVLDPIQQISQQGPIQKNNLSTLQSFIIIKSLINEEYTSNKAALFANIIKLINLIESKYPIIIDKIKLFNNEYNNTPEILRLKFLILEHDKTIELYESYIVPHINNNNTTNDYYYYIISLYNLLYGQIEMNNVYFGQHILDNYDNIYNECITYYNNIANAIIDIGLAIVDTIQIFDKNVLLSKTLLQPLHICSIFAHNELEKINSILLYLHDIEYHKHLSLCIERIFRLDREPTIVIKSEYIEKTLLTNNSSDFTLFIYAQLHNSYKILLFSYRIQISCIPIYDEPEAKVFTGGKLVSKINKQPNTLQQNTHIQKPIKSNIYKFIRKDKTITNKDICKFITLIFPNEIPDIMLLQVESLFLGRFLSKKLYTKSIIGGYKQYINIKIDYHKLSKI